MGLVNTSHSRLDFLLIRKREQKSHGHALRDLRHRYVGRIDEYIENTKKQEKKADRQELQRQFEKDMEDDLKHLRDELGTAKKIALTSQDVTFVILVAIAAAAEWLLKGSLFVPAAMTASEEQSRSEASSAHKPS